MRICFALLYYDPNFHDLGAFVEHTVILRYLPPALAARGHDVEVVILFREDAELSLDRVTYRAFGARPPIRWAASALGGVLGRPASLLEVSRRAIRHLASCGADVIHFHGTHLHLNHALLRRKLGPGGPPVVVHYHGGFPPAQPWLQAVHGRNMASAARVLVTYRSQADQFEVVDPASVRELVETSTPFTYRGREAARQETGMRGRPVYLSACRLHPIKDPFTTLRAFERILEHQPEAHLYHYYASGELLNELIAHVDERPMLREHVHFRGSLPRQRMEAVFNSADFLLQASRREFSGYAVLEAMACGVIPVVTDIPPFRAITGDAGLLFPAGDFEAMADAALRVPLEEIPAWSACVRDHFEEDLSFGAMAEELEGIYSELPGAPL